MEGNSFRVDSSALIFLLAVSCKVELRFVSRLWTSRPKPTWTIINVGTIPYEIDIRGGKGVGQEVTYDNLN